MIARAQRYACPVSVRAVDWSRWPAVVFESDDWGSTPVVRTEEERADMLTHLSTEAGVFVDDPAVMERLFSILSRFPGADGRPAVFTAFVLPAFPDFRAIKQSNFAAYTDIGMAEGFAPFGEQGAIARVWREGWGGGVFHPEFHARLHHTSPILWLELLGGTGPDADRARERFGRFAYAQGRHIPEFARMDARAQYEWTAEGIRLFTEAVGYAPSAAVTSDATPITEIVWAVSGIRTFCLRNCRNNQGEVVVYDTKPWNAQDPYSHMGEYDSETGLVSLNRNVFFENLQADQGTDAALSAIAAAWKRNEPALTMSLSARCSHHRPNPTKSALRWNCCDKPAPF